MNTFQQMQTVMYEMHAQLNAFYGKGVKRAGVDLRANIMTLAGLCKQLRNETMEHSKVLSSSETSPVPSTDETPVTPVESDIVVPTIPTIPTTHATSTANTSRGRGGRGTRGQDQPTRGSGSGRPRGRGRAISQTPQETSPTQ